MTEKLFLPTFEGPIRPFAIVLLVIGIGALTLVSACSENALDNTIPQIVDEQNVGSESNTSTKTLNSVSFADGMHIDALEGMRANLLSYSAGSTDQLKANLSKKGLRLDGPAISSDQDSKELIEGAFNVTVPNAFDLAARGRTVRVSFEASSPEAALLYVNYFTRGAGSSGWRRLQLSDEPSKVEFLYDNLDSPSTEVNADLVLLNNPMSATSILITDFDLSIGELGAKE